jgi:hypothetical protein
LEGSKTISIVHPAGALLPLKVLYPGERCALQGFIGLELYTGIDGLIGASSGFSLSGSTGNLRRDQDGHLLGDGIFAVYPGPDVVAQGRSLNLGLSDPPYEAPP